MSVEPFISTGGVSKVFGRSGVVVATVGDYLAAQVTNAADLANAGTQVFAGTIQATEVDVGAPGEGFTRFDVSVISTPSKIIMAGVAANPIASGALAAFSPVSGVALQNPATRDVFVAVPVTYNPTAGAAATCKVELSPDGVTYTTLATETVPAGIALDGTVRALLLSLPASWFLKLTATNAVIAAGRYY